MIQSDEKFSVSNKENILKGDEKGERMDEVDIKHLIPVCFTFLPAELEVLLKG